VYYASNTPNLFCKNILNHVLRGKMFLIINDLCDFSCIKYFTKYYFFS